MIDNNVVLDVAIIGNGFAGMNAARILAKRNITCEIFSSGFGASQLWLGTIDFLNTDKSNLQRGLQDFKKEFPNHPYHYLEYSELEIAFTDFSFDFPDFILLKEKNTLKNHLVLTTIGSLKPCIGSWNTIFREFDKLEKNSVVLLIDFKEFNNSAMNLVKRGLEENFKSKVKILNLSFLSLIKRWEPNTTKLNGVEKLSENQLANYFDKYYDRIGIFAEYLRSELKDLYNEVSYILFPPILGITKNQEIFNSLNHILNRECRELMAFSPSLMAKRFNRVFESKLEKYAVKIHKGLKLIDFIQIKENKNPYWKLILTNQKGEQEIIMTKYIIIAVGSLFQEGMFGFSNDIRNHFTGLSINIPNKISQNYELMTLNHIKNKSGIFVCGSALYMFMGEFSHEEEIKFGTGLGLAITSSTKVAHEIINYFTN